MQADSAIARAEAVRDDVLQKFAARVDAENRFPSEGITALRDAGLLSYFVPAAAGGPGGDIATYRQIASILGEGCLSSALTWVMHAHQVAVLADHHKPIQRRFLEQIAADGTLLASVTPRPAKEAMCCGPRLRSWRRSAVIASRERHRW